jgi:hypothetical protein
MLMKFVSAALLVSVAGAASAHHHFGGDMLCPELDPASLMSGLSLLLAGLAVMRNRGGKSPDA